MNLSHLYTNPSSHPSWLIPSQYNSKNIGPTFHILILASPWPFSHSSLALSIPAPCVLHFPFHASLPLLFPVLGSNCAMQKDHHCFSIASLYCMGDSVSLKEQVAISLMSGLTFSCCISEFLHKWYRTCIRITYLWNRCHPAIWHACTAPKHLL